MSKVETNDERSTEAEKPAAEATVSRLAVSAPRAADVSLRADRIPSTEGGVVEIVVESPQIEGSVILSNDEADHLADRIRMLVRRNRE